jgi:hypothetical protein
MGPFLTRLIGTHQELVLEVGVLAGVDRALHGLAVLDLDDCLVSCRRDAEDAGQGAEDCDGDRAGDADEAPASDDRVGHADAEELSSWDAPKEGVVGVGGRRPGPGAGGRARVVAGNAKVQVCGGSGGGDAVFCVNDPQSAPPSPTHRVRTCPQSLPRTRVARDRL